MPRREASGGTTVPIPCMFLFNVDHFCDFNIDFNIDFLLNICPYVGLSFLFLISLNDMEVISFLFFIDST